MVSFMFRKGFFFSDILSSKFFISNVYDFGRSLRKHGVLFHSLSLILEKEFCLYLFDGT